MTDIPFGEEPDLLAALQRSFEALGRSVERHRPVAQEPPAPLHAYVADTRQYSRFDTCGICGSGVNDSSKHPVPIYVHSRNPAPTSGQERGECLLAGATGPSVPAPIAQDGEISTADVEDLLDAVKGVGKYAAPVAQEPPTPATGKEFLKHMGTDAVKWAEQFMLVATKQTKGVMLDEDTVVGWFANAIEAGRAEGLRCECASGNMDWCPLHGANDDERVSS
jgi:hypothetical protein